VSYVPNVVSVSDSGMPIFDGSFGFLQCTLKIIMRNISLHVINFLYSIRLELVWRRTKRTS